MNFKLSTAVAFIVYNRPEKTRLVFESIKRAQPEKLFIIADGPRKTKEGDYEKCQDVRNIVECIDWKCEVYKNYSEENIGCKRRVSSGITWVFEHVDEAIILEDDCLPHLSFFQYCQELLSYYKDNSSVMMISGDNFQNGISRGENSYYFSRYAHIWGWATWRRAWQFYDVNLGSFPDFVSEKKINLIFKKSIVRKYWLKFYKSLILKPVDTWDYQWAYSIWAKNGLSVSPQINLISNIGFDLDALHTKDPNSKLSKIKSNDLKFPLSHPNELLVNQDADSYTFNELFYTRYLDRVVKKIKTLFKIKKRY